MEGKRERNSVKELFQDMIPVAAELLQGLVISTEPLKIQMINDSKLVIGETVTVVPRDLTDYETTADLTWGEGTALSAETKTESGDKLVKFQITGAGLTVHNALKTGEAVHILSLQNGKKYYVLGRV